MRRLSASLLLVALVGAAPAVAQQAEERPVVYLTQYQIPWARTDSLSKLLRLYPEWLTRATALGYILDDEWLIHMHGDEWNVVHLRTFPSWKGFADQQPDWATEVFRMVEPDSTKRAAFGAGLNWVFEGTQHRDNIYRKQ